MTRPRKKWTNPWRRNDLTHVAEKEMTFWDHLDVLRGALIRILCVWFVCGVGYFLAMPYLFDHVILAPCSNDFAFYGFLPVKSGRRAARIAEIAAEYRRLCLEAQDVVSAELRHAVPLAEGDIDRLKDFLCRRYHKSQAQLALVQDPALIGGFQLRVGDQVYDQSYRNALRQLKERLQSR